MPSTKQHNSLVELAKYQLDVSTNLANAIFSGVDKIDHAVLDVAHQMLDAQLKLARVAADLRDQSRMVELQNSSVCSPDKTMQCNQQIMSAIIEIQSEFGKTVRQYLDRIGQLSRGQLQQFAHQAETHAQESPVDQLAAVNPFVGMLSVWRDALEEAGEATSQHLAATGSGDESIREVAHEMTTHALEVTEGGRSRSASSRKQQSMGQRKS
jgi:hypothetical protein